MGLQYFYENIWCILPCYQFFFVSRLYDLVFSFLIPKGMIHRAFVMFNAAMWRQNKRRCFCWCSSLYVFNSCGRRPMRNRWFFYCVNKSRHSFSLSGPVVWLSSSLSVAHTRSHTQNVWCCVFAIEIMRSDKVNAWMHSCLRMATSYFAARSVFLTIACSSCCTQARFGFSKQPFYSMKKYRKKYQ